MKELEVIINNIDGVNVVSSRDVASGLGKRHDNVKRDLQNILKSHSSDLRNEIMLSKYTNNRGKECEEYLLTKDGFTLYMFNIQGYNEFKMAYINKFNEMERCIRKQQTLAPIQEISGILQDMKTLTERSSDNISKYETMLRVNCSKKTNFTRYIKNRLGIRKVNDEFEAVKSRVFCALGVSKWEDINLQQAESVLRLIDEGVTEIIKNRPYEQINWF